MRKRIMDASQIPNIHHRSVPDATVSDMLPYPLDMDTGRKGCNTRSEASKTDQCLRLLRRHPDSHEPWNANSVYNPSITRLQRHCKHRMLMCHPPMAIPALKSVSADVRNQNKQIPKYQRKSEPVTFKSGCQVQGRFNRNWIRGNSRTRFQRRKYRAQVPYHVIPKCVRNFSNRSASHNHYITESYHHKSYTPLIS